MAKFDDSHETDGTESGMFSTHGTESTLQLRARAEAELVAQPSGEAPEFATSLDARQLLHELRVYRLALELQSVDLKRAQSDAEAWRARYFELHDAGAKVASYAPSSEPHEAVEEREPVAGRILVVDDEGPLRRVMSRLLSCHEVLCAASGREAQQLLTDDQDFDVIVCDLMMPDLTGVGLHRWLSERNQALAGRMMFVSGGALGGSDARYVAACGIAKIDKPFDNGSFIRLVADRVRLVFQTHPREQRRALKHG